MKQNLPIGLYVRSNFGQRDSKEIVQVGIKIWGGEELCLVLQHLEQRVVRRE